MKAVESEATLRELQDAAQAILFVHVGWSGPSRLGLQACDELEKILWTNAQVFRMDPRAFAPGGDWLFNAGLDSRQLQDRDGGVVWLAAGKVVDWEAHPGKAGLEGLIQKTERAFSG